MSFPIPIKKLAKAIKLASPLVAGILLGACGSDDDADTTGPVISLQGDSVITLPYGQSWTDAGYSATDDVDGAVGVTVNGTVDVNKIGTYIISYTATDAEGNSSLVKRTVNVVDTIAPTISLIGEESISLAQNSEFVEPGVNAIDEYDGELTPVTIGELDTATPGTYTLTYTVTDSSGNHASVSRTVIVLENEGPDSNKHYLSGTATVGKAIVGQVIVKDAKGVVKTASIGDGGSFKVDITDMTPPFRLRAQGSAGERNYTLHSYAVNGGADQTANITPFTDLIVANTAGQMPSSYFDTATPAPLQSNVLDEQEDALQNKIAPFLSGLGLDASIDLIKTALTPANSALNEALGLIKVEINDTSKIATISSLIAVGGITDNITDLTDNTARLVVNDAIDINGAYQELGRIANLLDSFSALFKERRPSESEILPYFAEDFSFDDRDRNELAFGMASNLEAKNWQFLLQGVYELDSKQGKALVDIVWNDLDFPTDNKDDGKGWYLSKDLSGNWLLAGDQAIVDWGVGFHCNQQVNLGANNETHGGCGMNIGLADLSPHNTPAPYENKRISSARWSAERNGETTATGFLHDSEGEGELECLIGSRYTGDWCGGFGGDFEPSAIKKGDKIRLDLFVGNIIDEPQEPVVSYFEPVTVDPVANLSDLPRFTTETIEQFKGYQGGSMTLYWDPASIKEGYVVDEIGLNVWLEGTDDDEIAVSVGEINYENHSVVVSVNQDVLPKGVTLNKRIVLYTQKGQQAYSSWYNDSFSLPLDDATIKAEVTEFIASFNNALALAHQQNNGAYLDATNEEHQAAINKLAEILSPFIADDFKHQAVPKDVYLQRLASGYTTGNSFTGQDVVEHPMHLRHLGLESVEASEQGDQATISFYEQLNNEPLSATSILHTWQLRKDPNLGWLLLGDTLNLQYLPYRSYCLNYNDKDTPSCRLNYYFNPNQRLNFVDLADPEARAAAGVQTREYVRQDTDGNIVDIFDIAELDYQAATIEILSKSGQVNKTLYLNQEIKNSVDTGTPNRLRLYNPELGEFYRSNTVYLGEEDWYLNPSYPNFVVAPEAFEQGGTIRYRAYKTPIDYSNWQQPVLPVDEHTLTIEEPIVHLPTVQPVVVKPSSQSVEAFTKVLSASDNKFTLTYELPPAGYSVLKAVVSTRINKTAMGADGSVLQSYQPLGVSVEPVAGQNSLEFDLTPLALNEAIAKKTDPSANGFRSDYIRVQIMVLDEKTGMINHYFHGLSVGSLVGENISAQFSGDLFANLVVTEGTSVSGKINVSDNNIYQGYIQPQQDVASQYGSFSINASGEWSYSLNNDVVITELVTDTVTITSDDGTTTSLTIEIAPEGEDTVEGNLAVAMPSSATEQSTFDVNMSIAGLSATHTHDGKLVFKAKITEDLAKAATFSMACSTNFHSSDNRRVVTFYIQPDGQLEMWSGQLLDGKSYGDRAIETNFSSTTDKVIFDQRLVPGEWSEFIMSWQGASATQKPLLHAWLDGEKLTSAHPAIPDDPAQGFVGPTLGGKTVVQCLNQMQFYVRADADNGGTGAMLVDDIQFYTDKDADPVFDADTKAVLNEQFVNNQDGDLAKQVISNAGQLFSGFTTDNVLVVKATDSEVIIGRTKFGGKLSASMMTTDNTVTGKTMVSGSALGADVFQAQTSVPTSYGTFSISESGAWTYDLDETNSDVVSIGSAQLTDVITLTAGDGTTAELVIVIEAPFVQTPAEISGDLTATVKSDNTGTINGKATVTDINTGEAKFQVQAATATNFGSFSIDEAGAWSYDLDETNPVLASWTSPDDTVTDVITITTADGTQETLAITINSAVVVASNKYLSISNDVEHYGMTNIVFPQHETGKITFDANIQTTAMSAYISLFGGANGGQKHAMIDVALKNNGALDVRGTTAEDTTVKFTVGEWFPVEMTWDASGEGTPLVTFKVNGNEVINGSFASLGETLSEIENGVNKVSFKCGYNIKAENPSVCSFDNVKVVTVGTTIVNESFDHLDIGEDVISEEVALSDPDVAFQNLIRNADIVEKL